MTIRVLGRRALAAALLVALTGSASRAQEIRAFWADAFSPAIKSRAEVDDLLRRLRAANCNAIFAQVRKGGDAYYVSRYEPWASDNPERFDGLAYLVEKAHSGKPRIAVHAWINTCAVGRSRGNPRHIALAHPEWLSTSDKGADYDGEATKIDPGHPAAADQTFRVYMDVARRYDVDGIHFDFVRYGGTEWGYNPVSVARFNARFGTTGQPATTDPRWMQWRRDQVTQLVRKVYAMAVSVRPRLIVSAATITWGQGPSTMQEWETKTACMTRVFQDWRSWMEEGILDLNCLMSYYRETRHAEWFRLWIDWAKDHQYRRWAVPSSGVWLNTIGDGFKQIAAIRRPSRAGARSRGVLLYCYAGTNVGPDGSEQRYNEEFYTALARPSQHGAPPFANPSADPVMPWKARPTMGHVKGFVLDANSLAPVDGALVTLRSKVERRVRTDGTGFYAFVDVPPGTAKVTVTESGYASQTAHVAVRAGAGTSATVFMGKPSTPFAATVEGLRSVRDGTPVRLRRAVVVGGTDHYVDRVFVASQGSQVAVMVRLRQEERLPLQAGDVVALLGVAATVEGERVVTDATATLDDMQMPAPETEGRPWSAPGRPGRQVGVAVAPCVVKADGLVTSVGEDAVTLGGPVLIEVRLAGRKACGIEDEPSPIPAPDLASRVSVVGVVTMAMLDGRPVVRLWPRTPEDVRVTASAQATLMRMAAGVLAPPFRHGAGVLRVEGEK